MSSVTFALQITIFHFALSPSHTINNHHSSFSSTIHITITPPTDHPRHTLYLVTHAGKQSLCLLVIKSSQACAQERETMELWWSTNKSKKDNYSPKEKRVMCMGQYSIWCDNEKKKLKGEPIIHQSCLPLTASDHPTTLNTHTYTQCVCVTMELWWSTNMSKRGNYLPKEKRVMCTGRYNIWRDNEKEKLNGEPIIYQSCLLLMASDHLTTINNLQTTSKRILLNAHLCNVKSCILSRNGYNLYVWCLIAREKTWVEAVVTLGHNEREKTQVKLWWP